MEGRHKRLLFCSFYSYLLILLIIFFSVVFFPWSTTTGGTGRYGTWPSRAAIAIATQGGTWRGLGGRKGRWAQAGGQAGRRTEKRGQAGDLDEHATEDKADGQAGQGRGRAELLLCRFYKHSKYGSLLL